MSAPDAVSDSRPAAGPPRVPARVPLEVVVGFDGSGSALQALRVARQLAAESDGHVHVVFVAHVPLGATLSAASYAGVNDGFDAVADELRAAASAALGSGDEWTFERRDGAVAHELFEVADGLDRAEGHGRVVLVVGGTEHAYHRIGGSVPGHLVHQNRFPLTVVPPEKGGHNGGRRQ